VLAPASRRKKFQPPAPGGDDAPSGEYEADCGGDGGGGGGGGVGGGGGGGGRGAPPKATAPSAAVAAALAEPPGFSGAAVYQLLSWGEGEDARGSHRFYGVGPSSS